MPKANPEKFATHYTQGYLKGFLENFEYDKRTLSSEESESIRRLANEPRGAILPDAIEHLTAQIDSLLQILDPEHRTRLIVSYLHDVERHLFFQHIRATNYATRKDLNAAEARIVEDYCTQLTKLRDLQYRLKVLYLAIPEIRKTIVQASFPYRPSAR